MRHRMSIPALLLLLERRLSSIYTFIDMSLTRKKRTDIDINFAISPLIYDYSVLIRTSQLLQVVMKSGRILSCTWRTCVHVVS